MVTVSVKAVNKYLKRPRLRTREPFLTYVRKWVILSTVLGLLTGIIVALFDFVANLTLWSHFSTVFSINYLLIFPSLLSAFLISAFLLSRSTTRISSGTEEVVEAYNNPDNRMDLRSFPLKMLAAAATIGLGGSAGQEGPSIYAGGVVGSWISGRFGRVGLTDEDRRTLMLAGAAAGIGAVFKAPLTGIIFALEAPFKDDLAHNALVPSLLAAVISYLTLISIDGSEPLFQFPGLASSSLLPFGPSALDLVGSAVLGVIVGIAALAFIAVYKGVVRIVKRVPGPLYYKAVIGASVLTAIGIVSVILFQKPFPLGISYNLVSLSLTPGVSPLTLLTLFVMKLVATSFTLGTTGVGGIFVPQIVMGASVGGLFAELLFPSRIDLFVAVGMASFLAAGYKTPLAAVAFVAETTAGPAYLIPSLIAAAISYSISGEASVSSQQKLRDEVDITQIAHLKASDIMTKQVVAVPAELSVLDFVEEYLFVYQYKTFPIVDREGLLGRISLQEVKGVPREKWFETKISDICSRDLHPAYPDSNVQEILDLMYNTGLGRIVIVDRVKPRRLVGIISKNDIIKALENARLGK
ncbi:MAG TPA: chloride channel protein [Candidatus Dormibacteraeota bacterium]|nr:chloride channel protein [Candidatus Dormibacteraeota bacterium]